MSKIEEADHANVPVACTIEKPSTPHGLWVWTADNYMPRRGYCAPDYRLEADTKEEILVVVKKYVLPLYEAAAKNMSSYGENYYWEHRA